MDLFTTRVEVPSCYRNFRYKIFVEAGSNGDALIAQLPCGCCWPFHRGLVTFMVQTCHLCDRKLFYTTKWWVYVYVTFWGSYNVQLRLNKTTSNQQLCGPAPSLVQTPPLSSDWLEHCCGWAGGVDCDKISSFLFPIYWPHSNPVGGAIVSYQSSQKKNYSPRFHTSISAF